MQTKRSKPEPESRPWVGIILLNWNGWKDTFDCLKSLKQVSYPAIRVVVVDNASSEAPSSDPGECFPDVDFIYLDENLGYVGGNNAGMRHAREQGADYVLLLNNDTEVAPDFLERMVSAAETDPQVGMVGPTIYYYGEPDVIWSAGGAVDRLRGDTTMLGMGKVDHGQYGQTQRDVDWVTGCALLAKTELIERVGMLDERFFAYYEEAEWCARARRVGYRIVHAPQAKVWHKITRQAREASPLVNYYMARNRLLYLKLTGRGIIPWIYTLGEYGRRLASWSLRPKWRGKSQQRDALLRAIQDFVGGRFGKANAPVETSRAL